MHRSKRLAILSVGALVFVACSEQPTALSPELEPGPDFARGGIPGPPPGVNIPDQASFTPVRIDGVLKPAEWIGAAVFEMSFSPGISDAQLYVKNDEVNVYLALRATVPGDPAYRPVFLEIGMDKGDDYDVIRISGQGWIQPGFPVDRHASACGGPLLVCTPIVFDLASGGTEDTDWAWGTNGSTFEFEFAQPLDGGDSHDISVTTGDELTFATAFMSFVNAVNPLNPGAKLQNASYTVR